MPAPCGPPPRPGAWRRLALGTVAALAPAFALAQPDIRVADAMTSDAVLLHLDPAWPGWRDQQHTVEVAVDDAAPRALEPALPGLHTVTGLEEGTAHRFRVRVDGGAWSENVTATATRSDFHNVTCWSDGFHSEALDAEPAGLGLDAAVASNLNTPLRLASGAELELVGGPDSLFTRWYAYATEQQVSRPGEAVGEGQTVLPQIVHRHLEPLGAGLHLEPLEELVETVRVRSVRDTEERTLRVRILGSAGATPWPAVSATALDAEGDPVPFRFDRLALTGTYRDGTPWVVGPVTLRVGRHAPARVEPDRWIHADGARLAVVSRPGLVPLRATVWTGTPERAFSGGAEPVRSSCGRLTVVPGFETLHVYLQSDASTTAQVRVRERGTTAWQAASSLRFDARRVPTEPVDIAAVTPGNHRGAIVRLAPATVYEVEVAQGATTAGVVVATQGWKVRRTVVQHAVVHHGDLVIRTGGEPGRYAEHRNVRVIGGTVRVEASHVLLTDVEVLGAPRHGIDIANGVHDVRIVRGRVTSWGGREQETEVPDLGWGRQHDSALYAHGDQGVDGPHRILVIGTRFGSPRHTANTWEEWNPIPSYPTQPYRTSHPWGPQVVTLKHGSYRGGWTITDTSMVAHPLRSTNDHLGGDHNFTRLVGGFGPNFVLSHNYLTGFADDAVEQEGSAQVGVILGNYVHARRARPFTRSPAAVFALSVAYWGPTLLVDNTVVRHSPERWGPPAGVNNLGTVLKIQRLNVEEPFGEVLYHHNTSGSPPGETYLFRSLTPSIPNWGGYAEAHNNIALTQNEPRAFFPGPSTVWGAGNLVTADLAEFARWLTGDVPEGHAVVPLPGLMEPDAAERPGASRPVQPHFP